MTPEYLDLIENYINAPNAPLLFVADAKALIAALRTSWEELAIARERLGPAGHKMIVELQRLTIANERLRTALTNLAEVAQFGCECENGEYHKCIEYSYALSDLDKLNANSLS